jgi:60 kDa SS-A/Ro ribonucleoprotein
MVSLNKRVPSTPVYTHEGAPAKKIGVEAQLRRSVLATLLWEDTFYESGVEIATRIQDLASKNDKEVVSNLAHEARNVHGLRHAPLLLLLDLIKRGGTGVASTITSTIRRADEITELLALYWKFNPNKDLSAQLKKGISGAFNKFDEYQLAKYNRDGAVKLRDALFLSHDKPKDAKQEALFKKLVDGTLAIPDTWETNLSSGKDKKETFERLLTEGKLGYLALLRNLRNMVEAGVDTKLIKDAILARKGAELVFPFRFTAAARAAPTLEKYLDEALIAKVTSGNKFEGRTIVLVDVSGSMTGMLSNKSDLRRQDAAATLASVINGDEVRVLPFDWDVWEVPHRLGMAGVDAILKRGGGGTDIGKAVTKANAIGGDRLIVITDEQSHTRVPKPQFRHAYMINVASYQNGVGYGDGWVHIDGFSEAVLKYIFEYEKEFD